MLKFSILQCATADRRIGVAGHFDMSEESELWVPWDTLEREQKRRKLAEDKLAIVLKIATLDGEISEQATPLTLFFSSL